MYRYAAIYSRTESTHSTILRDKLLDVLSSQPGQMRTIYDYDGLAVVEWPDDESQMACHILAHNNGVILGHIFSGMPNGKGIDISNRCTIHIDETTSNNITRSGGQYLTETCWGSYVAIIRDNNPKKLSVLRSPFGVLPCFHLDYEHVSLLFSDPKILSHLPRNDVSIDWEYAVNYLAYTYIINERTGINRLRYLNHSQCMVIEKNNINFRYAWHPDHFCDVEKSGTTREAISDLKYTTYSCAATWKKLFPAGVFELSGGFDSSLVVGLYSHLSEVSSDNKYKDSACITYYHKDCPMLDERCYARQTAQRANLPLVEVELERTAGDFTLYNSMPIMPWPLNVNHNWKKTETASNIAAERQLTALISGHGGDALFGHYRRNLAAIDHAYLNGINFSSLPVAMQSARVSNTTLWHTLSKMVGESLRRHHYELEGEVDTWGIAPNVASALRSSEFFPYWRRPEALIPPGKRAQINGMMVQSLYFTSYPSIPFLEPLNPLMSQPIAELCLRIPFYTLQFDGRERGLARRAFAEFLTKEVRLRQFKSNGGQVEYDMIRFNKNFYRDYLLGGVLTDRRLLDEQAINNVLMSETTADPEHYTRIQLLANVEAWARAWTR